MLAADSTPESKKYQLAIGEGTPHFFCSRKTIRTDKAGPPGKEDDHALAAIPVRYASLLLTDAPADRSIANIISACMNNATTAERVARAI